MTDGLFTIQGLATISGCSLAVFLLTQLTKNLIDKLIHIPTDILSVFYAFIILILTQMANDVTITWVTCFLSFMNALLVSIASAQIHARALRATGTKKDMQPEATIIPPENIEP